MTRLGILIVALLTPALMAQTQPSATLRVRVTDAQGQPIPNAWVQSQTRAGSVALGLDATGAVEVPLPTERADFLFISGFAPGHVPALVNWWVTSKRPWWPPPREVTLSLPAGTAVGGRIVNEHGQPIAGAQVKLYFETADKDYSADHVRNTLWAYPVPTDAIGRWQCDMAPAQWARAFVQPAHPDYYSPEYLPEGGTAEQLRSGDSLVTMVVSRSVAGRVVDPDGKPVAGAVVQCGNSIGESTPRTRTSDDGSFRFAHAAPTSLRVLVRGIGPLAPAITAPKTDAGAKEQLIVLPRARTLRLRAVDDAGHALGGASLRLRGWRDDTDLWVTEWSHQTDADGATSFDVPPGVTAHFSAAAEDFAVSDKIDVAPDATDQTITLQHPPRIAGRVIDKATGQPIAKFRAVGAIIDENWFDGWGAAKAEGKDGNYELPFQGTHPAYRVRIEADGYLPAWSDKLTMQNGLATFDAALVAAPNLGGTVVGIDGKPVSGAHVMVLTASSGLIIINANFVNDNGGYYYEADTDARGRFTTLPPGEPFDVLVLHESGWAKVASEQIEKASTIQLVPWSRVVGTVRDAAGGPVAGVGVSTDGSFGEPSHASIEFHPGVKTDRDGHFAIQHVVAGRHAVARAVEPVDRISAGYQFRMLDFAPGGTRTADFGACGRDVIGRAILPQDLPKGWIVADARLMRIDDPTAPPPAAVTEAWSPVDNLYRGTSLNYRFHPRDDGRFGIPAVEPGPYRLVIDVVLPTPGGYCGTGDSVAKLLKDVTIEPSASPLNLGDLKLDQPPRLAIGEVAPEFECSTLDGKTIRLSDYRGKYVLLDFWATWCAPCREELPHLKAARQRFANDPRLAMIGLDLDRDREKAIQFARDSGIDWTQGFLGEAKQSSVTNAYHVGAIPSIWLIGPDGRIVAKGLRGTGIENTLAKHLP